MSMHTLACMLIALCVTFTCTIACTCSYYVYVRVCTCVHNYVDFSTIITHITSLHYWQPLFRTVLNNYLHNVIAYTGSQFVHSSVQRIQAFFSQLQFNTTTSERTRAFLMELLDPKGERMTLESQKIQEYVGQCLQPPIPGAESSETRRFWSDFCMRGRACIVNQE